MTKWSVRLAVGLVTGGLVVGLWVAMQPVVTSQSAPAVIALGNDGSDIRPVRVDSIGAQYARLDHPNRFQCGADNIGATLTELSTPCAAVTIGATSSLYITDVIATSTTGTVGHFILRSGTGTNCGTGTASVLPSAATVVRYAYSANTVAPVPMSFVTPIKVTADHGLCVLGIATQTVTIEVLGYVAP